MVSPTPVGTSEGTTIAEGDVPLGRVIDVKPIPLSRGKVVGIVSTSDEGKLATIPPREVLLKPTWVLTPRALDGIIVMEAAELPGVGRLTTTLL